MKARPQNCFYLGNVEGHFAWVTQDSYNNDPDRWKGYEVLVENFGTRRITEDELAKFREALAPKKDSSEKPASESTDSTDDEKPKPAAPKPKATTSKRTVRRSSTKKS